MVGVAAIGTGIAVAAVAVANGEQIGNALDAGLEAGKKLVTGIFAAVSTKIHEKKLAGLERNANLHFGFIGGNGPSGKDPNKWTNKWKKDIQKAIRGMRKRLNRLKGDKKIEKWRNRIEQLERRLQDLEGGP